MKRAKPLPRLYQDFDFRLTASKISVYSLCTFTPRAAAGLLLLLVPRFEKH